MTTPQDNKLTPGRDLDALVAEKVMGWTKDDGEDYMWTNPDRSPWGQPDPPQYSTSIEDAWEVVEKLSYCQVYKMGAVYTVTTDRVAGGACAQAQSNTAPHAICLAALKAVEHE